MNKTWRDRWEVLGFAAAVFVAAFGGLSVYNWLRFTPTLAVIAGLIVAIGLLIFGFRLVISKLDELTQAKWRKRLPVLLLPAPSKRIPVQRDNKKE